MKAIITGITGQDGAYLSKLLLSKGYEVYGVTRPNSSPDLSGLKKLDILAQVQLINTDMLNSKKVSELLSQVKPNEFYNLAAQSSVGLSFQDPIGTIHYNTISVSNILESIRMHNLDTRFYQASSSEMFGQVSHDVLPITEDTIFNPVSPYGISKASAHWITKNYREAFSLYSCSGILFNHESALRKNHFVTKKIITTAFDIKEGKANQLTLGNTDIKRDWGYAPDYVEAMWLMLQQPSDSPKDFIICSGTSSKLYDFARYAFKKLDLNIDNYLKIDETLFRPNELNEIYGSNEMASKKLGWSYNKTLSQVIDQILEDEVYFRSKGL